LAIAVTRQRVKIGEKQKGNGVAMNLSDLFSRLEDDFEIEIPEYVEEDMVTVQDVRDYIREMYRDQGMEVPAGAIFERVRRLIAVLARVDASAIQPETKLANVEASRPSRAWI
jgi:hypothetical protein